MRLFALCAPGLSVLFQSWRMKSACQRWKQRAVGKPKEKSFSARIFFCVKHLVEMHGGTVTAESGG